MRFGNGFGLSGRRVGLPTLPTSGLIDVWYGDSGIYSNSAATTPQTTNNGGVAAWKGTLNNVKLTNTTGNSLWYPKLAKDDVSAGTSSIDLTPFPAFLLSDAVGPISRNNFSGIVAVKKTNRIGYSIVSYDVTAGDYTTGSLLFSDGLGYPRLEAGQLQSRDTYPLNTWTILGFTCSPTTRQIYINGNTYLNTPTTVGGVEAESNVAGFGLGWCAGSSVACAVRMAAGAFYNRTLSAYEMMQGSQAIANKLGLSINVPAVNNFVGVGTSIEMGYNANFGYIAQMAINAGVSLFDTHNWGDSGYTTQLLLNRDTANNLPVKLKNPLLPNSKHLVLIDGITNSLGSGVSASQALIDVANHVTLWRDAGWKVAVRTVLDRNAAFSGGVNSSTFAVAKSTVDNAYLTNSGAVFGDFIWNVQSVSSVGTAGDGVHPPQAGHDTLAAVTGPLMATALGL